MNLAGCRSFHAEKAPRRYRLLVGAAVENRAIVLVAIREIDRVVSLHRKDDIANKRPAGKIAFDLCRDGAAFALDHQESACAGLGVDRLRRDLYQPFTWIASMAFAWVVLRITSGKWEIIRWASHARAGDERESQTTGKRLNCFHDTPR